MLQKNAQPGRSQLRRMLAFVAVLTSCAARPPREPGDFRPSELVELTTLDPTIRLDIRYATAQNLLHRPVYAQARAFLQRPAAEALVAVHRSLRPLGYGLLVFDGYRPWRVTKLFWDATPRANRQFVANPAKGSRHNRGCAIDLSLYALATGQEVAIPAPTTRWAPARPLATPMYPRAAPTARLAPPLHGSPRLCRAGKRVVALRFPGLEAVPHPKRTV